MNLPLTAKEHNGGARATVGAMPRATVRRGQLLTMREREERRCAHSQCLSVAM